MYNGFIFQENSNEYSVTLISSEVEISEVCTTSHSWLIVCQGAATEPITDMTKIIHVEANKYLFTKLNVFESLIQMGASSISKSSLRYETFAMPPINAIVENTNNANIMKPGSHS